MNILQVLPYLYHGAGRSVLNLSIEMKKKGHKSIIVTSKYRDGEYYNQKDLEEECIANNIKVKKINNVFKRELINIFTVSLDLNRIIKEEDIDIINAHAGVATLVSHLAIKNTKRKVSLVSTVRGIGNPQKKQWQKNMDNQAINLADKVIAISNFIKKFLIDAGIQKGKIYTVHNGIKTNIKYMPVDQLRKKYKLGDSFVIGTIGELSSRKNQINVIESLVYLRKKNIKLLIVGDGNEKEELEKQVKMLNLQDKVIFLGHYPQARKLLSVIDVFVLTPLSEAFGLVFAEAQMAGVPTIGSNLEGIKDIIKEGETGFLIPANDPKILANKIKKLIYNKELFNEMSIKGKEYTLNRFSLDRTIEETLSVYKNLLLE